MQGEGAHAPVTPIIWKNSVGGTCPLCPRLRRLFLAQPQYYHMQTLSLCDEKSTYIFILNFYGEIFFAKKPEETVHICYRFL